jgi:DNA polymerase phi
MARRLTQTESLFSNNASSERKYWGFQVFQQALPLLPASQMPLIFTPNFMRCWINNLSSPDRYLHKVAQQIAKLVQDVIKENPKVGFTLLSQLVGKHGRPDFDKVTKTKTVEGIMGALNGEGVAEFVTYLQGVVVAKDEQAG